MRLILKKPQPSICQLSVVSCQLFVAGSLRLQLGASRFRFGSMLHALCPMTFTQRTTDH